MFPRTSAAEIFERLRLFDEDVGKPEAEFASEHVHVYRECGKVVYVSIAGAWNNRSTDIVLDISSSSMVTVCNWTMVKWKGPVVRSSNLL